MCDKEIIAGLFIFFDFWFLFLKKGHFNLSRKKNEIDLFKTSILWLDPKYTKLKADKASTTYSSQNLSANR